MSKWTIVITGDGPINNSFKRIPGESESEATQRQDRARQKDVDVAFNEMVSLVRNRGHVIEYASLTFSSRITKIVEVNENTQREEGNGWYPTW